MSVTPEGARGVFVGMVIAGAPLHPDAVSRGLWLTDEQMAGALALSAELELHRAGEHFSIRRRVPEAQCQARPEQSEWKEAWRELYSDMDAVSTAILVVALTAEME